MEEHIVSQANPSRALDVEQNEVGNKVQTNDLLTAQQDTHTRILKT